MIRNSLVCAFAAVAVFVAASSYGQLNWSTATDEVAPITNRIQMHGSAVLNGYIYVFGGNTDPQGLSWQGADGAAGDSAAIFYAQITGANTGAWVKTTGELPFLGTGNPNWAYIERQVAVHNGRIYITSGSGNHANSAPQNRVTIITPETNGNILQSGINVVALTGGNSIARTGHATVIDPVNNRLYVVGGGSSAVRAQVDVADINPSTGLVSDFRAAGTLATGVWFHPAVYLGGRIYAMGGNPLTAVVQSATIDPGTGNLSAFDSSSHAVLPNGRWDGWAVVMDGTIYQGNGTNSSNNTTQDSVFRATINGSGVITSWTTDTPVPVTREFGTASGLAGLRRLGACASSNTIYVPGGRVDNDSFTRKLYIAVIPSAVQDWSSYE